VQGRNRSVNASGGVVPNSCIRINYRDYEPGMWVGFLFIAKTTPGVSTPMFTFAWYGALVVAVLLAGWLWRRLNDRTYMYYGAYVGAIVVMSLTDHGLGWWLHEHWGEKFVYLNNFLHLPYAVFYLLFVIHYFNVRKLSPGWTRFHRYLLWAYGGALIWLVFDFFTWSFTGSEWAILACNLVNLLSSLVLAAIATHEDRPGAREFLFACFPLTLSGLVLVTQFLANSPHDGGPGLLAFRAGFVIHVMIFLIALSVRYRELRQHLR